MLSSNTLDWPEYFSNCLKMNKQKDMPENE